jgi:hypothetical protein
MHITNGTLDIILILVYITRVSAERRGKGKFRLKKRHDKKRQRKSN